MKNCDCYNHIIHVARATWICEKCKADLSLEVVLAAEAGIDLLKKDVCSKAS